MSNRIFFFSFLVILSYNTINAQDWNREDSLWLLNVLDGKVDLKINEDTKKAIEDGRLIMPSWMKGDDGKIKNVEIIKDFDDAGLPDSASMQSIDPYSMPPAVYALYVLYIEKMDSIYESGSIMLSDSDRKTLLEAMPASARSKFYYSEMGGGIGGYDFNHLLSMVFSPSYRQKAKNRKNAAIYKGDFYTGEPSIKMTERERKEMNQAIRNTKPSISTVRTSEFKRNGIDD